MMARRLLMASACAALLMALAARILGPSDVWDQTQPKTVSYTTDMLVNGRWILPVERGEFPATKPPLYNWLAAPVVKLAGFASEWAHKSPSLAAFIAVWAITIWLGRRIDRRVSSGIGNGLVGWLAGLAIPTNYMLFKLGYLARPDMLLTLWLMLGWMAATAVVINGKLRTSQRVAGRLGFWICVALAGMTKGPAALVLIAYGLLAGKALTGAWRNTIRLGWLWGLPMALAIVGAWLLAVWGIDPEHLVSELWYAEVAGRVTGTGPKGAEDAGPWYFLTSIPYMPYYFLTRLAPWSVLAILAIVHLWRKSLAPPGRNWQEITEGDGRWYHACAIFIIVVVVIFSLSTGKRADYIAAAAPPAAILAAYWLLRVRRDVANWAPGVAMILAAITLAAMVCVNWLQPFAPSPTYGEEIRAFVEDADEAIAARPIPIMFYHAGPSHLQAFLGRSEVDGLEAFTRQLKAGGAFWLIAGPLPADAPRVEDALATSGGGEYSLTSAVVSDPTAVDATWPGTMTLWLVEPVKSFE
jgi:4-amino-4-deoxy-L-arabinose transferase-like glycosyltransferase